MSIQPSGPGRPHVERAGAPRPGPAVVRVEGEDALSAERLTELRGRVLDGSYDAPVVIEAIARTLIRSRVLA